VLEWVVFWPRRPPRPESGRYISDKTKTSRPFYIACLLDESDMPSSTSPSAGVGNNRSSVDESGTSDRCSGDPHRHRDAPAASVLVPAAAAVRATPTLRQTLPRRRHQLEVEGRACGAVCCGSSRLGSRHGHAGPTPPLDLDPVRCQHHQPGRPLPGTGRCSGSTQRPSCRSRRGRATGTSSPRRGRTLEILGPSVGQTPAALGKDGAVIAGCSDCGMVEHEGVASCREHHPHGSAIGEHRSVSSASSG